MAGGSVESRMGHENGYAPQRGSTAHWKGSGSVLATEWNVGSVLLSMIYFFFIFMLIWMFIAVFADIFRRNDLSGGAKALWILFIFVLPLIGILIYMISRPKMTEQDKEMMMQAQEAQRRAQGYSPADEVAKLAKLRDEGKITAEEYEEQKKRAMMSL
jgi:ABC-type multidrug transport system fused ATPase/permease subunit